MKTPLEVIQEGEREFEDALFQYETVASKDGFSEQYPTIEYERGKVFLKRQTLLLLQSLRAELENTLPEYWLDNESVPFHCDHNNAIKDCRGVIDSLDALIKELTT